MPTVYQEVEVEVELSDFETDDLIEELEKRGKLIGNNEQLINDIFQKRRAGQDFLRELDDLIYNTIGRFN